MDQLQDFQVTPWEGEGAARAGVRSALCLSGFEWQHSDLEAAVLVAQAFSKLGRSKRPSWQEGQPHYTIAYEDCNWCRRLLDESQINRSERFCSTVCAKSALQFRSYEAGANYDEMGRKAYQIVQKSKTSLRNCTQCGEGYHPLREGSTQKFCSLQCRDFSMRTIPDRRCRHCEEVFRPAKEHRIFCTPACAATYRFAKARIEKVCQCCYTQFVAKISTAMFCSNACKKRAFKARRRAANVIHLTAEIFDSWFREAA
ncbi:hypothetical protein G6L09_08130 [Agrobacterium rhizogenes]|nr:hypothetical protein [Rhizobium rhizogenes]NTH70524.1 hypothetical protein [Rhizobium rhizogenes]